MGGGMRRFILLAIGFMSVMSCRTAAFRVQPRTPLNPTDLSDQRVFHVHVAYFNEDDGGLVQSIDEIDARVLDARRNGAHYYRWLEYRIRSYPRGPSLDDRMEDLPRSDAPWEDYAPAIGFDYVLEGSAATEAGDLSNLPRMDSIPRDLTGFKFYTNVIDFHTWDIYRDMFLAGGDPSMPRLAKVGDASSFQMPRKPIPLLTWTGLSSDFRFEGGYAKAVYLADVQEKGTPLKLLFLDQNQRMTQNVYGMAGPMQLKMPYEGTSRLVGRMYYDLDDRIWRASFDEYVYSKVFAPVHLTVIVHSKRSYLIEREE